MRPDLRHTIRPVLIRRNIKTRHEVYVFIICVFLSLFLWLLIKASAESEATVSFPVEFINVPENKILVGSPVKEVTLGFEEKAASLFFFKYFKNREPIMIGVGDLPQREQEGQYRARLFTTHIMDYLNKHRNIPYTIISVSPDTIPLVFEDKRSVKVPVKARFELGFRKQFDLYGTISITPDSVLVTGPASVIDTFRHIDLGLYQFTGLDKSRQVLVDLDPFRTSEHVDFRPDLVDIDIPVEEYTEASAVVPVTVTSDTSLTVRTFPSNVNIRYLVALKDYQNILPGMFEASVQADLPLLEERQKLKVQLTETPEKVKVLFIEPDKVEFIIIK